MTIDLDHWESGEWRPYLRPDGIQVIAKWGRPDPTDLEKWGCIDCGFNTCGEYFVVRHDLWRQAVGSPKAGKLCVTCLEERLGRRLVPDDFLGCPANDRRWRKTDRLRERMGPKEVSRG